MLARPRALAIGVLAATIAACVEVPQEVRQTFAPEAPGETSYYHRRPDAPPPEGFVKLQAPDPVPAMPAFDAGAE